MRLWLCAQTISFALLFMAMHAQPCDWGVHLFQVGLAWIPVYRFGIFACNSAQIFLCVRYYLIMQSMARLAKTKWPNRRQSNSFARCRRVNVNLRWRVWTVAPQRRQTYVLFALHATVYILSLFLRRVTMGRFACLFMASRKFGDFARCSLQKRIRLLLLGLED